MLHVPDQATSLRELANIFPVVNSALNYATFKSSWFFRQQEADEYRKIDRYLAPNLVRFYALQALHNDKEGDFNVLNVPNNGLYLTKNNYNIRILKSCNGKLPVPGHSLARQKFYRQEQTSFYFLEDFDVVEVKLNLIILWEVTSDYSLGKLSLACPKSGDFKRESVTAHWHCIIPDLLLRTGNQIVPESIEVEDLPLTFSLDEEEGKEAL